MSNPKIILYTNKPQSQTSFSIIRYIRNLSGRKKAGHAGTPNPLAQAILLISVSRDATRRRNEFLHLRDTYLATLRFGRQRDTHDIDENPWCETNENAIHRGQFVIPRPIGTG